MCSQAYISVKVYCWSQGTNFSVSDFSAFLIYEEMQKPRLIKILPEIYIWLSKGPDFPKHRVPHLVFILNSSQGAGALLVSDCSGRWLNPCRTGWWITFVSYFSSPVFRCDCYSFFFFNFIIYLFNFWLCWVFVSVWGLSLVEESGGHSSSRCVGLSLSRPLLLQNTGSRRAGSVAVAHGPSCSVACGIFPNQGSSPCPPHWQADSQPLGHHGSPWLLFLWWDLLNEGLCLPNHEMHYIIKSVS